MTSGDLNVTERDASVQGRLDECGSQHVRVHRGKSSTLSYRLDPAVGGASVKALAIFATQNRTFAPITDCSLVVDSDVLH